MHEQEEMHALWRDVFEVARATILALKSGELEMKASLLKEAVVAVRASQEALEAFEAAQRQAELDAIPTEESPEEEPLNEPDDGVLPFPGIDQLPGTDPLEV